MPNENIKKNLKFIILGKKEIKGLNINSQFEIMLNGTKDKKKS